MNTSRRSDIMGFLREQIPHVGAVVTHGVEAVALACRVFPTGCDRERLADSFLRVPSEVSAG
jgi:hypothetical protein